MSSRVFSDLEEQFPRDGRGGGAKASGKRGTGGMRYKELFRGVLCGIEE